MNYEGGKKKVQKTTEKLSTAPTKLMEASDMGFLKSYEGVATKIGIEGEARW